MKAVEPLQFRVVTQDDKTYFVQTLVKRGIFKKRLEWVFVWRVSKMANAYKHSSQHSNPKTCQDEIDAIKRHYKGWKVIDPIDGTEAPDIFPPTQK